LINIGNKHIYNSSKSVLSKLKKKAELLKKYTKNSNCLSDALSTGIRCDFILSSHTLYNEQIEKDIYDIVELFPEFINSKNSTLKCRNYVSPFVIALWNKNIPLKIIDLLIRNGAKLKPILLNGLYIDTLTDIKTNNHIRFNQIKHILITS
jgi:hypothetical protein